MCVTRNADETLETELYDKMYVCVMFSIAPALQVKFKINFIVMRQKAPASLGLLIVADSEFISTFCGTCTNLINPIMYPDNRVVTLSIKPLCNLIKACGWSLGRSPNRSIKQYQLPPDARPVFWPLCSSKLSSRKSSNVQFEASPTKSRIVFFWLDLLLLSTVP